MLLRRAGSLLCLEHEEHLVSLRRHPNLFLLFGGLLYALSESALTLVRLLSCTAAFVFSYEEGKPTARKRYPFEPVVAL